MHDDLKNVIERLAERFPHKESAILPALTSLQDSDGYVSEEGMRTVSAALKVPEAMVFSTASFYSMLNLRPEGKYIIRICTNVVCTLLTGNPLFEYISDSLGIREWEVTPDGLFSIQGVECLGACGSAPAMMINSDRYENVTYEMVDEILDSIQKHASGNGDRK